MIEVEDFLEEDFDRFISWIKTEEDLVQFAGPAFTFPVTHNQLLKYNDVTLRRAFKIRLESTGEVIGHCEINLVNPIPRLSRILIANPALRNKGLGTLIVKTLLDIIFSTTSFDKVDLSVFDWNKSAIASYQKVGFKISYGHETQMEINGKKWNAVNMVIHKQDYLKTDR